jgi:rhodanese-related sulfurtransferase
VALTLLLPATAVAQDSSDGPAWPSADALRRDLQDIGYEFTYDAAARAQVPEFQADWPALWRIAEQAVTGAETATADSELFNVEMIDSGDGPTFILFGTSGQGAEQGALDKLSSALMEIATRLPQDSGIEEAVWYMSNLWLHEPGSVPRTTLPCFFVEFEGGAAFVAPLSEGEATPGFFGAVGPYEALPGHQEQVEQCKAAQAGAAEAQSAAVASPEANASTSTGDHLVPPDEAVAIIEAGSHTVIDVRTPAEYAQAHVVGASNIDVEAPDFADQIAVLDPDEPYLVYCRSGNRSAQAAEQMAAAGFTDVVDAAGLADLARAGAPVE